MATDPIYIAEDNTDLEACIVAWGVNQNRRDVIKAIVRAGNQEGETFIEAINAAIDIVQTPALPLIERPTVEAVADSFAINDEQSAAVYAAVFGTDAELLTALQAIPDPDA